MTLTPPHQHLNQTLDETNALRAGAGAPDPATVPMTGAAHALRAGTTAPRNGAALAWLSLSAAADGEGKPALTESGDYIHYGIGCDRSGQNPIIGNRYKLRRANYDLCEEEFLKLPFDDQVINEDLM